MNIGEITPVQKTDPGIRTVSIDQRFPTGLTLQQELARAIPCRYCGMLVFWNTHKIFRRTGKPMLCDAISGAPKYKQNHNCIIRDQLKKEQLYFEDLWANFVVSVRPSTLIALYGEDNRKVAIQENISFVIKESKNKK